MATIEELRAKAKRRRVEVRVLVDSTLLDEHARLESALAAAAQYDIGHNEPSTAPRIAREIQDLESRMADESDLFVFESLGATRWYELVAEHPPTKAQKEEKLALNELTFQVAAIIESCVDPAMSQEDVEWLRDILPKFQWEQLWLGCMTATVGGDGRPKSVLASTILRLSEPLSVTPLSEASPDLGSLATPPEPSPSTTTMTPDA